MFFSSRYEKKPAGNEIENEYTHKQGDHWRN